MSTHNEDGIILPTEILSQQVCAVCHKYLSSGPVMVTHNGRMICGRCKVSPKEHPTPSLYNQIAEEYLFPCTNEGCRELLPFAQVKDHEARCGTDSISCPFCKYKAGERRLVRHFKEDHSEYVVHDMFEVIPRQGFSRNLVFLKAGQIMCMNVVAGENGIHFVTPHIRITRDSDSFPADYGTSFEEEAADPYVEQENYFLLAKDFLANCLQSDSYHCKMDYVGDKGGDLQIAKAKLNYIEKCKMLISSLEFPRLPNKISFKNVEYVLKMDTATLRQFVKNEFVKMQRCTECKKSVKTKNNAFFCPREHLACKDCLSSKCGKCDSFLEWSSLSRWHRISLKCEWDCNLDVEIFEYLQHVQLCDTRRYKCPDRNCRYVGCLDDFKEHWHLNELMSEERLKLTWTDRAFYWLLPDLNELVYITVERRTNECLVITLYEDDAILPTSYELYGDSVAFSKSVLLKNRSGRFLRKKNCFFDNLHLLVEKVG